MTAADLVTDRTRILDANSPMELDQDAGTWLVDSGEVDLFLAPRDAAGALGRRFHIGTAMAGTLMIGSAPIQRDGMSWQVVAVGCQASARYVERGWVAQLPQLPQIESGLAALLGQLAARLSQAGRILAAESAGSDPVAVAAGTVLNCRTGLAWFTAADPVLEVAGTAVPEGMPVPLGTRAILRATAATTGTFSPTAALDGDDRRRALIWLQSTILGHLAQLAQEEQAAAAARFTDRATLEQQARAAALGGLAGIDSDRPPPPIAPADQVLGACQLLGQVIGVPVQAPPDWAEGQSTDPVRAIARASSLRVRAVTLTGPWPKSAIDAILAFRDTTGAPVVLAPKPAGGYELIDPATGDRDRVPAAGYPVTGPTALRPTGYVLLPPLPSGPASVRRLLGFGLGTGGRDLRRMLWFSLVTGALSMAVPVATGVILGKLVPQGDAGAVVGASIVLFLVVFATTGFLLGRAASLLRLQGRMLARMQSGLWDRLIALPVSFFTRYSVADLSQRVAGIEAIQQIVASVGSQTLLALVTLLFSVGLLFVYSVPLAGIVLAVTAVTIAISASITWQQIKALRAMYDAKGEASGVLLQLVMGVDKIRAAAAENRALGAWSARFAGQAKYLLRSESLSAVRTALYAALPVVLTLVVFAVVGSNPTMMSTSAFLAFITALGQITASTTQLDLSLGYSLNILPLFDRMRPILTEPLEIRTGASDPGQLTGRVALNNVTYRYPGMSAPVLQGINLEVGPQEFVAVVGPSGSGKSTLVRLLLGFDRPEEGTVTYDGKDLATLDSRAVRAQIGVALQNSSVTGGDILAAIVGDWPLTEEDAWDAAERVGLADDIRALPMGMHTMLGENAATFSGGQRQRLVLAGAIARNPRLVILDEATSALDSVTQAHVMASFENLQVSRLVIAHRLSTIRNADRIVVLQAGRIVEVGTFAELSAAQGVFAELVARQLA